MAQSTSAEAVKRAETYYDSDDADRFYFNIWGGEDIHIGLYESEGESIAEASRRTVARMARHLAHLPAGARVIDLGAGYGGSARYLAREHGFQMVALNLSKVQNDRDRDMNKAQGLEDQVEVYDGSFEETPYADSTFDGIWSQDSFLHSADRFKVFQEMDRILKPGGDIVFTDPMQKGNPDPQVLQPVLDRIHLPSLGSIDEYKRYAGQLGWEIVDIEELPEMLPRHYGRVLQELESREAEMRQHVSQEYIDRMKNGLRHWVKAGQEGALDWGILHFRKAA